MSNNKHNDDKEPGTDVDPHVKVTTLNGIWFKIIGGLLGIILAGVSMVFVEVLGMSKDVAAIKARDEMWSHDLAATQIDVREHASSITKLDLRVGSLEIKAGIVRAP